MFCTLLTESLLRITVDEERVCRTNCAVLEGDIVVLIACCGFEICEPLVPREPAHVTLADLVHERHVDLVGRPVVAESALLLHAAALVVAVVVAHPHAAHAQVAEGVAQDLAHGLRNDALVPEGLAEPVSELAFVVPVGHVGVPVEVESDGADGAAVSLEADGVGLGQAERAVDDGEALLDALVGGPARDGADVGVLGKLVEVGGVAVFPGAQYEAFGLHGDPFILASTLSHAFSALCRADTMHVKDRDGGFGARRIRTTTADVAKGVKGDKGATGPQGPQGPAGTTPDLSAYATKQYVDDAIAAIVNLEEEEF